MSQAVLCIVASQLQQAEFFTIVTDECVDSANNEQLVICFRHVDDKLEVINEIRRNVLAADSHAWGCISVQTRLTGYEAPYIHNAQSICTSALGKS